MNPKDSNARQASTSQESLVRFENVTVRFDETVALDGVSFELRAGETCVIYGSAGSGKTTLLKVALGLIRADSGKVYLFGQEITRLPEHDLFDLRARVGILFQEGALFDSLTIADNVSYPLLNQRALNVKNSNGNSRRTVEERVFEALKFVELEKTLEKFPSELSGGMRRRVGIARAVVTEPALELYDSPTAGLDPITANTIIALIIKERDTRNAGTIMVTHRYQDGQLMANFRYNPDSGQIERAGGGGAARTTKFFVMREGKLVFEGSEDELKATSDDYVKKFLRPTGG